MYNVVCGTYETPLYGWKAHLNVPKSADNIPPNKAGYEAPVLGGVILEQIFAYSPHTASIRAVAAAGEWLVSTSTDEALKCVSSVFLRFLCVLFAFYPSNSNQFSAAF